MSKFIGEYNGKVDDKGRLVFPSSLKSLAATDVPLRLVVKKALYSPCLELYAYQEWEQESENVRKRLNLFNRRDAAFWRAYMGHRDIVEPDKTGRILISKELLDLIGIDKEVVFLGCDFKIELWDKETYQSSRMADDEFEHLAEELLS